MQNSYNNQNEFFQRLADIFAENQEVMQAVTNCNTLSQNILKTITHYTSLQSKQLSIASAIQLSYAKDKAIKPENIEQLKKLKSESQDAITQLNQAKEQIEELSTLCLYINNETENIFQKESEAFESTIGQTSVNLDGMIGTFYESIDLVGVLEKSTGL